MMIERFQGDRGRKLLIETLAAQKMVLGVTGLAEELADAGELMELEAGATFIEQETDTNDVFFIVSGTTEIIVNGRAIGKRGPGDHVGEMAAIQPTQSRSATATTLEKSLILKVPEAGLTDMGTRYPQLYKSIAQELSKRLLQRNRGIGAYRDRVRVFIISSVEALPVARLIENAFEHDSIMVDVWDKDCFKVANYTIDDLEAKIDNSDFAVAIAHADDITESRDKSWPAPRDNVIFELGMFMGRLGRERAILMEPRDKDIKLPSDLAGVMTIPYRYEKNGENARLMAPACNKLRTHIERLGANNG
ncbi:TIR domain-containing protein [Ensifer adhaerens]|jgi:CRP/FNR family cyclic AMP-dependent transcriptional regulator|uniref:TIR domain-containing protein n=1 Tax=Ensifer adhaerens TaxID=106592 RepID=UPI00202E50F8|nr:TIR domain-containing protein [Ensifer adhaerens]